MNKELNDFIQYRVARAREALDEAEILADSGHWNACVNRLYYDCFYAVSALLSKHDLSSSKHSGLRSFFNHNFVKTGIIPINISLDKQKQPSYTSSRVEVNLAPTSTRRKAMPW
jgi:uncharacterized protein (UPF0332 family)